MLPDPGRIFIPTNKFGGFQRVLLVSRKGTWHDWLNYFLNGVTLQSEDALSRAERINALLARWRLQVAGSKSQVPLEIIEHFAVNPYLTVNKVAALLEIAYSTAQRGIQRLKEEGIIKKTDATKFTVQLKF